VPFQTIKSLTKSFSAEPVTLIVSCAFDRDLYALPTIKSPIINAIPIMAEEMIRIMAVLIKILF
jgi:hypothetical protein